MTRPFRGGKTRNPEYVRRNEPRVGEETMEKGERAVTLPVGWYEGRVPPSVPFVAEGSQL